jgi:hypothetical protein
MSVCQPQPLRGAALLLFHCATVTNDRPSARARLERKIGGPLTQTLVGALIAPQGVRGSSSP